MLRTKGSCFIDAVEIALGVPTEEIVSLYKTLLPGTKPEETGFHPSVVNILLLERFGTGLSEIDAIPTNEQGEPVDSNGNCVNLLNTWLNTHGFRCVLQGPRSDNGEEHAIAFRDSKFIDPSDMTSHDVPPIAIRSVWVLAVPPRVSHGEEVVPTESD